MGPGRGPLTVLACCVALATGCSSSTGATTASSSVSTTRSPSASPSAIELGADPGAAAYRLLDVCALVPTSTARAAAEAASWSEPTLEPSGPARCTLTDGTDWVSLAIGAPRDRLPRGVAAPTSVSDDVDRSAQGTVVIDKACTSGHVVASGYLLDIAAGSPSTHDSCSVLKEVGGAIRSSLASGPPTYELADGSTSARDLCAALLATDLPTTLDAGVTSATADDRGCVMTSSGERLGNVIVAGTVPRGVRTALREAAGEVAVSEDECTAFTRIDDRGSEGGPAPYWLGLRLYLRSCPGAGPVLEETLLALRG